MFLLTPQIRIKDCQHGNVMRFSQHVSPVPRGMVESQNTLSSALLQNCEWERFFQLFGRFLSWWTEVDFEQTLFGRSYETGTDCDNQLKWCLKNKRNAALGQLLVVFWCDIFKNQSKVWLFFSRPFRHHLPPPQWINRRLSLIERIINESGRAVLLACFEEPQAALVPWQGMKKSFPCETVDVYMRACRSKMIYSM